ncbi:MAG TPA: hypothetical protein VFH90_02235, partial [Candidatus Limnocylindria bacterium]|nr:hypothetical protein [Candidatus Limnocylindria bacterium]
WIGCLAVLVLVGCRTDAPSGSVDGQDRAGLVRRQVEDVVFWHPREWAWFGIDDAPVIRFTVLGYLATIPIDTESMCTRTANSVECNFARYQLAPGTLTIRVTSGGRPGGGPVWDDNVPAGMQRVVVAGMPGLFDEQPGDGTRILHWSIARPNAMWNSYEIFAEIRPPNEAEMRAQIEAMLASLEFVPAVQVLPADPDAAHDAARLGIAALRADPTDGPTYACMPAEPGARQGITNRLPMNTFGGAPLPVTCTLHIEATRWQMWRMRLTWAWTDADNRTAGEYEVIQWLQADGSLGAVQAGGDDPFSAAP